MKEKLTGLVQSFSTKFKENRSFRYYTIGGLVLVAALGVAGVLAFNSNDEYKKADDNMKEAEAMVAEAVTSENTDLDANAETDLDVMSEEDFDEMFANLDFEASGRTYGDYLEEQIGIQQHKIDPLLYERIDFDKLAGIVPQDVDGWLYIPNTSIDYVVMHGDEVEPEKYLWKDPYGNKSSTGSLFVKYESDAEQDDDHKVIYGHRLKDHSIYFGALLDFRDQNYAKDHSVAYYYTNNRVYRYNLYSVNDSLETDMVYLYPYTINAADYDWLIENVNENANFVLKEGENYDPSKRMLVLSTCSGPAGGMPDRLYLVFEEDCYWNYGGISTEELEGRQ